MAHKFSSTLIAENVADFVNTFIKFPLHGFWARGESREYDTPFLPSIWREDHAFTDKTPVNVDTTFTEGELASLKKCQADVLSGSLKDEYFLKFIDNPSDEINLTSPLLLQWAALAQHYSQGQKHPTRLIDITRDPLVALYFAVSDHSDHSGFVYYFKDNFNELNARKKISFGGTYFDILEIGLPGDYPCHPQEDTITVAKTPFPNRRVEAQRGAFCWTRGIDIGCHKGSLIIEIPKGSKETILTELKRLNYDDYALFPDEPINL